MQDTWQRMTGPLTSETARGRQHIPHDWISMVQDINAGLLIGKYLIIPDDAFPIAKDHNARAKAMVDLVTLQVKVRRHGTHIRYATEPQLLDHGPHNAARRQDQHSREKTVTGKTPAVTEGTHPLWPCPSCTGVHGDNAEMGVFVLGLSGCATEVAACPGLWHFICKAGC